MHHHEAIADTTIYTGLIAGIHCVIAHHYRGLHRLDEEKMLSIVVRTWHNMLCNETASMCDEVEVAIPPSDCWFVAYTCSVRTGRSRRPRIYCQHSYFLAR